MNTRGKPCLAGPTGPEHRRTTCALCQKAKTERWRIQHREEYLRTHRLRDAATRRRRWLARLVQPAIPFEVYAE